MEVLIRVHCDDRGFRADVEAGAELIERVQGIPGQKTCTWKWKKEPAPDELYKQPNLAEICRRLGGPNWRAVGWLLIDKDGTRLWEFPAPIKSAAYQRPVA
jgi:hypothetical protein